MIERQGEKKLISPYLPFKTFLNFLDRLKVGIPTRIDRSLMNSFSGAVQAQLLSTLKYLLLISEDGVPVDKLQKLVVSQGEDRKKILREILTAAYPFLFEKDVDLKRTTLSHLQELFEKAGNTTGGTTRKCMAFFIAISTDAGIEISPHLKVKGLTSSSRNTSKKIGGERNSKTKADVPIISSETVRPQPQVSEQTWEHLLLSKFPSFDPAWPDEVKTKWFDGFKELMDSQKKG